MLVSALAAVPAQATTDAHEPVEHKNSVAVLVGGSTEFEDERASTVTLGIEYERRITSVWGLAAVSDYNFGDFKRGAFLGVGVTARPVSSLRFLVAACVEFVEKDESVHSPPSSDASDHGVHSVFRVAAAYEFEYHRYTVAPTVSVDFAGETETILGYGF